MITVVIPVYNCEKYVGRAIQSILNQPCADQAEILVVNDGSKDRSGEICDQYASQNANVRVLHKENGGVSSARNLGIEQAKGNYIAFLDSDDWWEPNFLDEDMVAKFAIGGGGADVYEFAFRKVNYYRNMGRIYDVENETRIYEQPERNRYDWQHPCSYVYCTSILKSKNLRFPLVKIHEDVTFVEMVLYWAKTHRRIKKIIFNYWECFDSYLHTKTTVERLLHIKTAFEEKWKYFDACGCTENPSAQRMMALTTAESLLRVCAELSCHGAREFVNMHCNRYLREHPEEKLWPDCQKSLEAYNRQPSMFWLKSRVLIGVPMFVKRVCYRIPGVRKVVNYLFSKYIMKMTPIRR